MAIFDLALRQQNNIVFEKPPIANEEFQIVCLHQTGYRNKPLQMQGHHFIRQACRLYSYEKQ